MGATNILKMAREGLRPALSNVVEGAVITFNVSELKSTEAALANQRAHLAMVVHDAFDAVTMTDLESRTWPGTRRPNAGTAGPRRRPC